MRLRRAANNTFHHNAIDFANTKQKEERLRSWLENTNQLLYCASQNHNNRQCCTDLGLADPILQVGDHCLRMCDVSFREWRWRSDPLQQHWETGRVSWEGKKHSIDNLSRQDLVCLANWNVIMYCHHGGLKEDWS
uniref:Domain of unknown function DB domain-containing protein n=1 Tax=Plectus sambesii TaxID=2011161 RepID=A0A914VIL6_9BILA